MISLNQLEPVDLRKFPPSLGRMTPTSHFVTIVAMRRTLVALALVAAAGVVGALAYASYSTEQEFVRLVASGDEAAEAGRVFESLEAYSGALALVPDAVVAYLKRGRVYQLQGESEAALRDLRRAAELDPSSTRPLEWLGDISLDLDRVDRAAEYFQRYVALDDRNARVLYKLALARYRAGAAADAMTALDAALGARSRRWATRDFCADSACATWDNYRRRGRRSKRRQASPGAPGPREALAEVYATLGEHSAPSISWKR